MGWEDAIGRARFVFDHQPDADDLEHVSAIETEVIADFQPEQEFRFTVDVDPARPWIHRQGEGWWAYIRREDRAALKPGQIPPTRHAALAPEATG